MTGFISQLKIKPVKNLQALIALLYVAISFFVIIRHEYINGEFYYYFFKSPLEEVFSEYFDDLFAKNWYANVNKIIFPINFWLVTTIFFLLNSFIKKTSINFKNALSTFRYALIFHLFILLATYTTEIIPDFSVMPGNVPPRELINNYRIVFVGTFFTLYYIFCFNEIKRLITDSIDWYQWSIIFSPLTLFFLPFKTIHIYSFSIALIIAISLINNQNRFGKHKWSEIGLSKYAILFISILALFFRFKYVEFFISSGEQIIIFNADGEAYYNSAKNFFTGNIEGVNFYQTPLYSFYLSAFFELFGPKLSSIFYCQALIGSTVPLIIYGILTRFKYSFAGILAAFFIATDPLCIHYSVSINRSSPLLVTIPLIIFLCLHLEKNFSPTKFLILGSLAVATFYMGPETLPILLGIGGYVIYLSIQKGSGLIKTWSYTAFFLIGVSIISIPINAIHHKAFGKWILLGRDSQADHTSTFFYKSSPPIKKMIEMGFNPISDPQNSLELFLQQPLTIIKLIVEKLIIELPGFLLDPEAVYFAPIHLNMESFYGAHLQFYIYLFLIIGGIYLIKTPRTTFQSKALIFGPIICQAVMTSIVIFGTNRFRAPIVPLNFILVGIGVWIALFYRILPITSRKTNFSKFPALISSTLKNKHSYLTTCQTFIFIGLIFSVFSSNKVNIHPNYKFSKWMAEKNGNSIVETFSLKINSAVVVFIVNTGEKNGKNLKASIPICNFLIPGKPPFFVFSNGKKFLNQPKRIQRGCSIVKVEIPFFENAEALYLYFYNSEDGDLDLFDSRSLMANFHGQIIPVQFYQKMKLKNKMINSEVNQNYRNYSKEGILIGEPMVY